MECAQVGGDWGPDGGGGRACVRRVAALCKRELALVIAAPTAFPHPSLREDMDATHRSFMFCGSILSRKYVCPLCQDVCTLFQPTEAEDVTFVVSSLPWALQAEQLIGSQRYRELTSSTVVFTIR